MPQGLTRLYPAPVTEVAHTGCYLHAPLVPEDHEGLFVYSNFITSLDGRIAVVPTDGDHEVVPGATANSRDWRLFQELAGPADVLLTSGRYLRELEAGTAQDVLPVGTAEAYADIRRWRLDRDLPEQPAVAVMSASLAFDIPPILRDQDRRILVLTVGGADPTRARALEAAGAEVITVAAASDRVPGGGASAALAERGFRTVYCVTGPYVLGTLVGDGVLDALFLTTAHCLLGGQRFSTFLQSAPLDPAMDFRLTSLYYDAAAPEGVGQTLARYDRRRGGRPCR